MGARGCPAIHRAMGVESAVAWLPTLSCRPQLETILRASGSALPGEEPSVKQHHGNVGKGQSPLPLSAGSLLP